MSQRRQVWESLAHLLSRVDGESSESPDNSHTPSPAEKRLEDLEQEVRKLGKTLFKANILAESQSSRWEDALETLRADREQKSHLLQTLGHQQTEQARSELLEAILPALDGLEHAISSGQGYLKKRDLAARKPDLTPFQAILVSPADRAMLSGWLNGLGLVRERLLAILEAGGVTPIPSVGHPFDPYLHVAVGTVSEAAPGISKGIIIAEEQRGYRTEESVLRFAEVVVYKP
ncbi:MAG: nucleotide exchange factor GrpE [Anaerolineales bacterium]|nr:nucleotide exchange factor GrpE [Chloroflexota bacterium]MBL7163676.1 nucleotide exchange factor GrpE [Anaerolineales bacterium]